MRNKPIASLGIASATTTIIWIVLMVLSEPVLSGQSVAEKVKSIESNPILYILIYLNASLLTALTVAFFSSVYMEARQHHFLLATIGFFLISIYGVLNLISYLSQVFLVPFLLQMFHQTESKGVATTLLNLAIHTIPGSAVTFLNCLAYAILGISSIIFPCICFRKPKILALGGLLLGLSGILSLLAFAGLVLSIESLYSLLTISGIVYFMALFPIIIFYAAEKKYTK